MKPSQIAPYTIALLWTCTSCGFVKEGRQPHMECPSCGAYKTAYIDIPQHIENEVRTSLNHGAAPNCTQGRRHRLRLMEEQAVTKRYQVKGRFLP